MCSGVPHLFGHIPHPCASTCFPPCVNYCDPFAIGSCVATCACCTVSLVSFLAVVEGSHLSAVSVQTIHLFTRDAVIPSFIPECCEEAIVREMNMMIRIPSQGTSRACPLCSTVLVWAVFCCAELCCAAVHLVLRCCRVCVVCYKWSWMETGEARERKSKAPAASAGRLVLALLRFVSKLSFQNNAQFPYVDRRLYTSLQQLSTTWLLQRLYVGTAPLIFLLHVQFNFSLSLCQSHIPNPVHTLHPSSSRVIIVDNIPRLRIC